jgi:hypothetical protein
VDDSAVKILLVSVAVSFALGFGTAMMLQPPEPEPLSPSASAAPQPTVAEAPSGGENPAWSSPRPASAPVSALPANASVDELWARALLPDRQEAGYDAEDRLRKRAQGDPVALRSLLNRYSSVQSAQERDLLKSILSTVQAPDVIAFSSRLAASSNVADRKYGFEMLQSVAPDSPETRSLVRRTLQSEQSPEVLVQAMGTLQTGGADPEEAAAMVAQLKTLAQHPDPAVRSLGIQQLGQWDKKGEGTERLVLALSDRVPEVRQAAVFAIAQSSVRSDSAKAALVAMVNDPQETRDARGSALQALERFALSREEYASVAQTRAQLRGQP